MIGVVPLGKIVGRERLLEEAWLLKKAPEKAENAPEKAVRYSALPGFKTTMHSVQDDYALDPNHTHFLLVDTPNAK